MREETTSSASSDSFEKERGMTREERINAHHARIEKIIAENRQKQGTQQAATNLRNKSSVYLQPPDNSGTYDSDCQETVTIKVTAVSMREFCRELSAISRCQLVPCGTLQNTLITVDWDTWPLTELLDEIRRLQPQWIFYDPQDRHGLLEIWDIRSFQQDLATRARASANFSEEYFNITQPQASGTLVH